MNTTSQEAQTSNSDFIFAWAMQRYSAKPAAVARLQKPEYTAEQIAVAVASSGNPTGF